MRPSPRGPRYDLLARTAPVAARRKDPLHALADNRPRLSSLGFRQRRRRRRPVCVAMQGAVRGWETIWVAVDGGVDEAGAVAGGRVEAEGFGGVEERVGERRVGREKGERGDVGENVAAVGGEGGRRGTGVALPAVEIGVAEGDVREEEWEEEEEGEEGLT